MYLDGVLVHEHWIESSVGIITVQFETTPGWHRVTVEYFDAVSTATLELMLRDAVSALRGGRASLPCQNSGPNGRFSADYYGPVDFSLLTFQFGDISGPVLGNDCLDGPRLISFGAGQSPPGTTPPDFTAVIERDLPFAGGMTTFDLDSDDGVRLYIDDIRVLDDWTLNDGTSTIITYVPPGIRRVRLEFRDTSGPAKLDFSYSP